MGLFTSDDRERAAALAEQAADRPGAVAETVVEEGLPSADDAPTRVYAARALADASAAEPEAVLPAADALRALLDDEADVRSNARRGLSALADHLRARGEAALDRAADRLDAGDPDAAETALEDARGRFARAEGLFEGAPAGTPVLEETLGVRTVDEAGADRFTPLLQRGTELPASTEWTFTTGRDNQQSLEMTVLRAPGDVADPRPLTGEEADLTALHLRGLPPAPAGVPVLAVRVKVDEDGAITAALVDRGTGTRVEERAGTAAVGRAGGDLPDPSPPPAVAERLADLEARVADVRAPEPMPGGTAVEEAESAPGGTDLEEPESTAEVTDPDEADDDPVTGPGKHSVPRSHAERTDDDDEPRAGPGEREIERALDARDDLQRAIEAETDDPAVVRDGVAMTVRRLDGDDDGTVAAVREVLAAVVDADADDVAALRERARGAIERVDEVLSDAGVEVVDPDPGQPAEADRHHVVETAPADQPEDHVVSVEQTGYARDGTVRRPARVQVSEGSGTDEETAGGSPVTGDAAEAMPGDVATPTDGARDGGDDAGPPDHVPAGPALDLEHAELTGREVLARGRLADVYRATVERDGVVHELRVTEPTVGVAEDDGDGRAFDAAIRRWVSIDDHDHVVDVVDWGTDPVAWVATEHADGGALADRGEAVDLRQAVWTAVQVADAVHHAHRDGVGHFGLQPASVHLRAVEGAWPVPKVAGFGLAKHLFERAESVDGDSLRYTAPEQLADGLGTPGPASDVYAVGAIAYELVTGRPPFTGPAGRVVEQVVEGEHPPPSQVNPAVPADLEAVVQRAMARAPGDRYENAGELRDALRTVLAGLR